MTDWIPNHHHSVTAGAALASSETALLALKAQDRGYPAMRCETAKPPIASAVLGGVRHLPVWERLPGRTSRG